MKRLILIVMALWWAGPAWAAVSRDASTPTQHRNTAATSETVTFPTCTAASTTIGIICAQWGGATCSWSGNTPSGWSVVPDSTVTNSGNCYICYYEMNPTGGSVNISGTASAANSYSGFCYDGVNASNPFDSTNMVAPNAVTGTSPSANQVTPTIATDALVADFQGSAGAASFNTPTNSTTTMTLWQATGASSSGLVDNVALGSTQATGATGMTSGSSIQIDGFQMLLAANTAPTPTPTVTPKGDPNIIAPASYVLGPVVLGNAGTPSPTPAPLNLGTTSGVSTVSCASVAGTKPTNFTPTCKTMTVTCNNANGVPIQDDVASVAISTPAAGATPRGVIVFQGGTPETQLNGAATPGDFADQYVGDNYTVVQTAWSFNPSTDTNKNALGTMVSGGCRSATLLDWIWHNVSSNGSPPMCAWGHSMGSGQNLYADLDYASGASAPGPRMDSEIKFIMNSTSAVQADYMAACVNHQTVAVGLVGPSNGEWPCSSNTTGNTTVPPNGFPDSWMNTNSCSNNPTAADEAIWTAASLDNTTYAISNYTPQTKIAHYECYQANEESPIGTFVYNLIPAANITDVECAPKVSGTGQKCTGNAFNNPTNDCCTGETFWSSDGVTNNNGFTVMYQQMEAQCHT